MVKGETEKPTEVLRLVAACQAARARSLDLDRLRFVELNDNQLVGLHELWTRWAANTLEHATREEVEHRALHDELKLPWRHLTDYFWHFVVGLSANVAVEILDWVDT